MTLRDKEAEKYAFIGIGVNNKGEEYKDYDIRKMKGFKAGFDLAVKTVKAEIERRRTQAAEKYNESTYSMGRCDAFAEMLNFIQAIID